MSGTAFCSQCGERIALDAKFCNVCGAPQFSNAATQPPSPPVGPPDSPDPSVALPADRPDWPARPAAPHPPSSAPPPGAPPDDHAREFARQAAERLERATPGAGEFAGQLVAQLSTPGIAAAGLAALLTVALMLAVGLVLGMLPSHNSLFLFEQGSIVDRMLVNVASFTSAPLKVSGTDISLQTMPMIFILLPLGGMAVFTAAQRARLALLPPVQRLAFGAAGSIPLALLVLIIAIAGKIENGGTEVKVDVVATVLLTLLWGGMGGAAGAWWTLRRDDPSQASQIVPPRARAPLRALAATVRPLILALAMTTVIGIGIVIVESLSDTGGIKGGRSAVAATVEDALYAPEHGLHVFELGSFVQFRASYQASLQLKSAGVLLPIPVDKTDKLLGKDQMFRVFEYADAVPAWLFILGLLAFIAVPLLFALYAGFAAARAAGALTPQQGAAWGALTGPAWAILLVILNGVANKTDAAGLWGLADGGSVFGFSLLIGAALGALGGVLAVHGRGTPLDAAHPHHVPPPQVSPTPAGTTEPGP